MLSKRYKSAEVDRRTWIHVYFDKVKCSEEVESDAQNYQNKVKPKGMV